MKSNVATEEYTNLVYETSKRRITLAGYRLANFVMDVYNSSGKVDDPFDNLKSVEKMLLDHAG